MTDYYIKRDELLEDIEHSVVFTVRPGVPSAEVRGANMIIDRIQCAPAADVVEVRHAKFLPTKNFSGLKCSACGARVKNGAWRTHKWCYACGAKMDGGGDDGKNG